MKDNQRVRISKQCLRESLIRLLSTENIHKISVREICAGAGINRTTFYKYYGSQYELLEDMENEAISLIDEYLSGIEDVGKDGLLRLRGILTYIQDNIDLFRLHVNNTVDTDFLQRIINLPMIRQLLSGRSIAGYNESDAEYIFCFIIYGCISTVKSWINKDSRESPEEITALLMKAVDKMFL
jgi:AcrR family transcriptional regulator